MSRKDYVATAQIIRDAEYLTESARSQLVTSFVTMFADENPRFSPSKFRQACEPEIEQAGRLSSDFEALKRAGYRAGYAAGSWIIDGNSSEEVAREVLREAENCELEIPAPLSGEWADGWSAEKVFAEVELLEPVGEDEESELLSWFESGYYHGFEDAAVKDARSLLGLYPAELRR